ncbi:hypothetical protein HJD18_01480 [Thermoleophilia bacterium SCSIO 60948]|nr:hypothetical protein HJD18_01480 [Thermoleophilia bacterium SCSIO 60948]
MSVSTSVTAEPTGLPGSIAVATREQPGARLALAAAVRAPSHAYLFSGPAGSGKRAAARALAAELIAEGSADPDSARGRTLAVPSPHPDLVWLEPPGMQHLVDQVRSQVIAAASYRPFESERRVFVIAAADAMADESQNALLKTLEEPAPFAHLILLTAEPEAVLETVRSRCRTIDFAALAPARLAELLGDEGLGSGEPERLAVARLAAGDGERARMLLTDEGRALRGAAEATARAARRGDLSGAPWKAIIEAADAAAEIAGEQTREQLVARAAELGEEGREVKRALREAEEGAKRARRRARNATIDLGLALLGAWVRDLAAVGEGAPELCLAVDRVEVLAADADGLDPRRARRGVELVLDTRRRLTVNVAEELALEALVFRLEFLIRDAGR